MSLIVYECQKAEHGHEIRQFQKAAQSLYEYFDGLDETAVFIGNVNVGEANLDGLIVKNDAIIIVEFKDYEGAVEASQNAQWTCDGKPIKGGNGGKTVFEQLRKNQRILRKVIAENNYFTEAQRCDIKGIVVFSKLTQLKDDFDRKNKSWVFVTDVENIGNKMHEILSCDFKNIYTGTEETSYINNEDIFSFIRKAKIKEEALVTDFSDTTIMPQDLYHKDFPHNGKYQSTLTLLGIEKEKNEQLEKELEELKRKQESVINEKNSLLNEQKEEMLKIKEKNIQLEHQLHVREQKESAPLIDTNKHIVINDNDYMSTETTELKANVIVPDTNKKHKCFGMKEKVLKEFDVDKNSLDSEQIGLIERTLDNSMIVSGCAGSGKSVIAMYKTEQIIEEGGDVILIAYTKSLERYMEQGKTLKGATEHFYYHWQWVNAGKPSADYIIVDEIQDFSKEEIIDFINATKKCFFFFGDSAQSIYKNVKKTLTIKEISELTNINISYLNSNYRLPKPVAKITQTYVGVGVPPYADAVYQSKETELPRLVSCKDNSEQVDFIINLIKRDKLKSVGILVPCNNDVLAIKIELENRGMPFELKYNAGYNDPKNIDTLDFKTQLPKLMTYHSAKGLQFETVILPYYDGALSDDDKKSLYVAMTRTYRFLYVLFNGNMKLPLKDVDPCFYKKSI